MTETNRTELVWDRHLPWPSGSPYERVSERLEQVGAERLGPHATAKQVVDALFDLMSREDRMLLDELRHLDRRLLLDFFMYQFPVLRREDLEMLLADRPMPVEMPDVSPLLDVPGDFLALTEGPVVEERDLGVDPLPVPPEWLETPPADIGPACPDLRRILEQDDVRR